MSHKNESAHEVSQDDNPKPFIPYHSLLNLNIHNFFTDLQFLLKSTFTLLCLFLRGNPVHTGDLPVAGADDLPGVTVAVHGHCTHGDLPLVALAVRANFLHDVPIAAHTGNSPIQRRPCHACWRPACHCLLNVWQLRAQWFFCCCPRRVRRLLTQSCAHFTHWEFFCPCTHWAHQRQCQGHNPRSPWLWGR